MDATAAVAEPVAGDGANVANAEEVGVEVRKSGIQGLDRKL